MVEEKVSHVEQAVNRYNLVHWGDGFFSINEQGQVCVNGERGVNSSGVALLDVVAAAREAGLRFPMLLRFGHILEQRLQQMSAVFQKAMERVGYQGHYTPIYPIKVNQQRDVIEALLQADVNEVGLEAGSKPELMAVMALAKPGMRVVCNGYKDRDFISLAVHAQRRGLRVHVVLENLAELRTCVEVSRSMQEHLSLGVRVRLASIGRGQWQNTGGEKSKFGFSAPNLIHACTLLKQHNMLDCLHLLHFHMGSQIANIRDIQVGLREAVQFFLQLRKLGANIETVDVGGGLGVDYQGSRSRDGCSMNYSMQEYADTVISVFHHACQQACCDEPNIITEAGRAMVAHHAVLVTDVVDVETYQAAEVLEPCSPHVVITHLQDNMQQLSEREVVEVYHDATATMQDAERLFIDGQLDLKQRAQAQACYQALCQAVYRKLNPAFRHHRVILDELQDRLADKYFANFSVFRSLPDAWAIAQVFPIMPLSGLDQPLGRRAVLQDMTCDSDGRIDRYVDCAGLQGSLLLPLQGERPLLGFFMVGAYQEILGDDHNLFGDVDAVQVSGGVHFRLSDVRPAQSVSDILSTVGFKRSLMDRVVQRYQAPSNEQNHESFQQLWQRLLGEHSYFRACDVPPSHS